MSQNKLTSSSSSPIREECRSVWTQVGVRESGSYLTETQDDIQFVLQSYGLDSQDDIEQLIYEFDSEELYFW